MCSATSDFDGMMESAIFYGFLSTLCSVDLLDAVVAVAVDHLLTFMTCSIPRSQSPTRALSETQLMPHELDELRAHVNTSVSLAAVMRTPGSQSSIGTSVSKPWGHVSRQPRNPA